MKHIFCKKTLSALLVAIMLASVFVVAFAPSSVAYASSWGGKDVDTLWYYGEEYLDVASAKEVVSGWDLSKVSTPVVMAVVDTGIDAKHELFADDENGVSVLSKNANGDILGYNSLTGADESGNVDISDEKSKHGSAVAGNIAMLIREFGLENYIKIYPIKAVRGCRSGGGGGVGGSIRSFWSGYSPGWNCTLLCLWRCFTRKKSKDRGANES